MICWWSCGRSAPHPSWLVNWLNLAGWPYSALVDSNTFWTNWLTNPKPWDAWEILAARLTANSVAGFDQFTGQLNAMFPAFSHHFPIIFPAFSSGIGPSSHLSTSNRSTSLGAVRQLAGTECGFFRWISSMIWATKFANRTRIHGDLHLLLFFHEN